MKFILCLLYGSLLLCALQAPPAEKPKDDKCSIEGRVVNAVSGDPIRKATLMLARRGGSATPSTTETDDIGHFAFRSLDPGRYMLFGERAGFARQAYGARSNPYNGTTLLLSAGQQIKEINFRLTPSSVISGRVLDEEGEPVPNAVVMALRTAYQRGERQFVPLGAVQSNDVGEFRIPNLAAGRYLVSATPRNIGIGMAGVSNKAPSDKPEPGYITTFYPNSSDPSAAPLVQVKVGADAPGTDIRLVKVNTVRIRGKLAGAPPGKTAIVWLMPKGGGVMGLATRAFGLVQATDGAFEIKGVAPGSYMLTASTADSASSQGGSLPLQVGEQHIEGILLPFAEGGELSGTVSVEGKGESKLGSIQVALVSLDFLSLSPSRATPGDDGKFTLKGISPDRYQVSVVNGPENSYVKSVHYGNQEAAEAQIDLTAGLSGALQITLSQAGAQVDGTIRDAEDKPLSGATVVLVPDSRRYSMFKDITSDQNGGFSLRGVTPGEYKILAWEDIETGAYQDPEFLKRFESQAQAVSLKEADRKSVSLRAIASASGQP